MAIKIDRTYEVLDGPSREELFDSLRLRDEHRLVKFDYLFVPQPWEDEREAENGERKSVHVKVYRIAAPMCKAPDGHECDTHQWFIAGMSTVGQFETEDEFVSILFSTQRRTGQITFSADAPRTPGENKQGFSGEQSPDDNDNDGNPPSEA